MANNNCGGVPLFPSRNNHRNNDDDDDDVQLSLMRNVQVNLNQDDQEESVRTVDTFHTGRGDGHDEGSSAGERNYVSAESTTGEMIPARRRSERVSRMNLED